MPRYTKKKKTMKRKKPVRKQRKGKKKLIGKQKKLDKNGNGHLDRRDFEIMRSAKK